MHKFKWQLKKRAKLAMLLLLCLLVNFTWVGCLNAASEDVREEGLQNEYPAEAFAQDGNKLQPELNVAATTLDLAAIKNSGAGSGGSLNDSSNSLNDTSAFSAASSLNTTFNTLSDNTPGNALAAKADKSDNKRTLKIVASSFPAYDLVNSFFKRYPVALQMALAKMLHLTSPAPDTSKLLNIDFDVDIKLLVPLGADIHTFDASLQAVLALQEADIIVAVGGEIDKWINDLYAVLNTPKAPLFKLSTAATLLPQIYKQGMEEQSLSSYDEHVWLDAAQAPQIQKAFAALCKTVVDRRFPNSSKLFAQFAQQQLTAWQAAWRNLAQLEEALGQAAELKQIFFADRFPLRYLCERLQLDYLAAFPGCNANLDPATKTLVFLQNAFKASGSPLVFYTELSRSEVAEVVADSNSKLSSAAAFALLAEHCFSAPTEEADVLKETAIAKRLGAKVLAPLINNLRLLRSKDLATESLSTTKGAKPFLTSTVQPLMQEEQSERHRAYTALWRSGHTVSKIEFSAGVTLYDLELSNLAFLALALGL